MSDQPATMIPVSVKGDADIELFIVDHNLELMQRVPLPWSGTLRAGVYRFKFRRGTTLKEETVFLDPAQPSYTMAAPALETRSSAPLESSIYTHEYHMGAAHSHSQTVHKTAGSGGRLFLFVRDWTEFKDPVRTDAPAAGLQVLDTSGNLVADVAADAAKGGTGAEDRWVALNLELTPGSYLLRLTTRDDEKFEQSVVVSPTWQTQVFLLLTNYGSKEQADWRADLARATMLMAPAGRGFSSNDDELRLTDTALTWLVARQRTTAGAALEKALDQKYQNPILGLYAAHAMITGRGDSLAEFRNTPEGASDTAGFDEAAFRRAVANLIQLVPGHPDAIALQLWLDDTTATGPLANPPMLANSWPIIVAASAAQPSLIPRGSLASKIGGSLYGSGAWLMWMPDQFAAEEEAGDVDVWGLLDAVQSAKPKKASSSWYKGLDLVQRAMLQYAAPKRSLTTEGGPAGAASAPGPRKPRNIEDLIRSIGLPLATLQNAAARLSRQSQKQGPASRPRKREMEGMDS